MSGRPGGWAVLAAAALAGAAAFVLTRPLPPESPEGLGAPEQLRARIAEAESEAVRALHIDELHRLFLAAVESCTGIGESTWPGRLRRHDEGIHLLHADEENPALEVNFVHLKEVGLDGEFASHRPGLAPDGLAHRVLAAGLHGVFAPGEPCPS